MSERSVLVSSDAGVAVVTLNRPEARNALDTDLVERLRDCLRNLAYSEDVRCCVLTGAGPAFCAGADLKQRQGMTPDELERHTIGIRECADLLEELPVPVIAAVNGPAYGGGLEMAVACDVRIASDRASFALPEVKLGIFPGAGGPIRLPRLLGPGWARLMIFSGEVVSAAEALRIGLVQRVVADDALTDESISLASSIALLPSGIRANKRLMNRAVDLSYPDAAELSDQLRAPLNRHARWEAGLRKQSGKT